MTVLKANSREARARWRDLLDHVYTGSGEVIIERNGKPVAVMISVEDYQSLRELLEELRASRMAFKTYQDWQDDPTTAIVYSDYRQQLIEEGLLDE